MSLSSHRRGMLGVLAVAFGAAFGFGHANGEPKAEPVRAQTLTVAGDVPPIPALAVGGAVPTLAKPFKRRRRPRRHDGASPARHRVIDQRADSPAAASPSGPRPAAGGVRGGSPAPSGGGRRSGGGGDSGGDSADDGPVTPAATPAPVQVAPEPVEPAPEESDEPEEEAAPEEETE